MTYTWSGQFIPEVAAAVTKQQYGPNASLTHDTPRCQVCTSPTAWSGWEGERVWGFCGKCGEWQPTMRIE